MLIAEPSVKSLRVTPRANGSDLGDATAFLVLENGIPWLITNWHVLSGRNAETQQIMSATGATPETILIRFHGLRVGDFYEAEVPLRDGDGLPLWLEHPISGSSIDVASLQLPADVGQVVTTTGSSTTYSSQVQLYSYNLTTTNPSGIYISVGERLSVIGFPTGEDVEGFPVWTQGFVASEPDLRHRGLPCFLVDSRTRKGQSGSPVVFYSANGQFPSAVGEVTLGAAVNTRFMGIYSGRINAESDIGRVWLPEAISQVVHGGVRSRSL